MCIPQGIFKVDVPYVESRETEITQKSGQTAKSSLHTTSTTTRHLYKILWVHTCEKAVLYLKTSHLQYMSFSMVGLRRKIDCTYIFLFNDWKKVTGNTHISYGQLPNGGVSGANR